MILFIPYSAHCLKMLLIKCVIEFTHKMCSFKSCIVNDIFEKSYYSVSVCLANIVDVPVITSEMLPWLRIPNHM